jgi:hypothetical protein
VILEPEVLARLDELSELRLECDGLTRMLAHVLAEADVDHVTMAGDLLVDGRRVVPIHYWIELEGGHVVDYRARMWAGDRAHVPRGVFNERDYPRVSYRGDEVDVRISPAHFEIMVRLRGAARATGV